MYAQASPCPAWVGNASRMGRNWASIATRVGWKLARVSACMGRQRRGIAARVGRKTSALPRGLVGKSRHCRASCQCPAMAQFSRQCPAMAHIFSAMGSHGALPRMLVGNRRAIAEQAWLPRGLVGNRLALPSALVGKGQVPRMGCLGACWAFFARESLEIGHGQPRSTSVY